jgi:hypothetical protein
MPATKHGATGKIVAAIVARNHDAAGDPYIQIGAHVLTSAQAMAVRVAITNFHMRTAEGLDAIDMAYHARLGEVLKIMLAP